MITMVGSSLSISLLDNTYFLLPGNTLGQLYIANILGVQRGTSRAC